MVRVVPVLRGGSNSGHVELVSCVEYQVDTFDIHDFLRSKLGITAYHDNVGSGISVDDFPNHLPSFFLCNIRDAHVLITNISAPSFSPTSRLLPVQGCA